MGLYIYWDDQQAHTIRVDVVGQWVWSDYHTQLGFFTDNMKDTIARACIIDMRHTQTIPPQNALNHMRQILDETPALATIIISENPNIQELLDVLKGAIPDAHLALKLVSSVNDAYELIENHLKG